VAVLLVLGRHFPHYTLWARIGWIGVDLFFVLSGFLISGLLFQDYQSNGSINFRRFIIRRAFKIYPSFYLLIVATALTSIIGHRTFPWRGLAACVVFFQNYVPSVAWSSWGIAEHTWSLAVEEHFYLLLPALLILLVGLRRSRDPFSAIPALFLLVSSACLALRCLAPYAGEYVAMTHLRIDSLFAGVALGYLYHFRRVWFQRLTGHYALVVAVPLLLPAAFFEVDSRIMQTVGLSGLFIGFGFLVAWSVDRTPASRAGIAISRFAAQIGFYSYSIYLWHRSLPDVLRSFGNLALMFWLYVLLSISLGITMAVLVELPFLTLRDKFFACAPASAPNRETESIEQAQFLAEDTSPNETSESGQCQQRGTVLPGGPEGVQGMSREIT
jgi:peptidoglycan/LPS O-acetylase OafA/YrhL